MFFFYQSKSICCSRGPRLRTTDVRGHQGPQVKNNWCEGSSLASVYSPSLLIIKNKEKHESIHHFLYLGKRINLPQIFHASVNTMFHKTLLIHAQDIFHELDKTWNKEVLNQLKWWNNEHKNKTTKTQRHSRYIDLIINTIIQTIFVEKVREKNQEDKDINKQTEKKSRRQGYK